MRSARSSTERSPGSSILEPPHRPRTRRRRDRATHPGALGGRPAGDRGGLAPAIEERQRFSRRVPRFFEGHGPLPHPDHVRAAAADRDDGLHRRRSMARDATSARPPSATRAWSPTSRATRPCRCPSTGTTTACRSACTSSHHSATKRRCSGLPRSWRSCSRGHRACHPCTPRGSARGERPRPSRRWQRAAPRRRAARRAAGSPGWSCPGPAPVAPCAGVPAALNSATWWVISMISRQQRVAR